MNELDLFVAALAISDLHKRSEFLERECSNNPALRQRIDALLAGSQQSKHPLDRPARNEPIQELGNSFTFDRLPDTGPLPTLTEQVGAVIGGKYTLVEPIGEGGMGSVWRAKQTEPVKRFVAVKLIKAGMDSKQVLSRFEAERQALALMDHPCIAKVLDGGIHERRPFFVMELVKGTPITEYCDVNRLTPQQRLELFVPVCQAIQHAHQKGIIHRDIKPANVLVALYDDKPVPKVIDFGVAKATGGTLTEATIETGVGGVVGTPQYMSPEQATFNNLDIDTRSDVYALGVLLYELLTGNPPFSMKELQKKGLLEILRVVREEEPHRPSTKISTADALPSISASRSTEPKKLAGLLRNELDWIVMKALEKDRTRRYETANSFAADVMRYLSGEAVLAHPPSTSYRIKKFVKRNRGQVIAASLVALSLFAGVIGTSFGLLEALRQTEIAIEEAQAKETARAEEAAQRRIAETNEKLAETRLLEIEAEKEKVEIEKERADEEKQIAKAVSDFLQFRLLAQADVRTQANMLLNRVGEASEAKPNPTIRELLDRAAKELTPDKIEANFPDQALVQAQILRTVGQAYVGIGEAMIGIPFISQSVGIFRDKLGPDHRDTLHCLNGLASAYRKAGKREEALLLLEETLSLSHTRNGPDHPDTPAFMNQLALCYAEAGKLDKALPMLEEALTRVKAHHGIDPSTVLAIMHNLANCYVDAGKLDKGISLQEETLVFAKRKLGLDHPNTLNCMNSLGTNYAFAGRLNESLVLLEETLAIRKTKLGPDHPDTLSSMNNLASSYQEAGNLDKSQKLFEETFALMKSKLGPDHPNTLVCMSHLGFSYLKAGKGDEAISHYEETLSMMKVKLGPDHPNTLACMSNLASAYRVARKMDKSMPLREETLSLTRAKLGFDHPKTLDAMHNLAVGYSSTGQRDKSLKLFEETLKLRKAKLGDDHHATLGTMAELGLEYKNGNQVEMAVEMFTKYLAGMRKRLQADNPQFAKELATASKHLLDCGDYATAESMLRECLAIREEKQPDDWSTFNTCSLLGAALLAQKKYVDAEPLLTKGYEGLKPRESNIPPAGSSRIPESIDRLIQLYTSINKPDVVTQYKELRNKYAKPQDTK